MKQHLLWDVLNNQRLSPLVQDLYGRFHGRVSHPLPTFFYRVCKGDIALRHVCFFRSWRLVSAVLTLLKNTSLHSTPHVYMRDSPLWRVLLHCVLARRGPVGQGAISGTAFASSALSLLSLPFLGPSRGNKPQVLQTLNWNWMLDSKTHDNYTAVLNCG